MTAQPHNLKKIKNKKRKEKKLTVFSQLVLNVWIWDEASFHKVIIHKWSGLAADLEDILNIHYESLR